MSQRKMRRNRLSTDVRDERRFWNSTILDDQGRRMKSHRAKVFLSSRSLPRTSGTPKTLRRNKLLCHNQRAKQANQQAKSKEQARTRRFVMRHTKQTNKRRRKTMCFDHQEQRTTKAETKSFARTNKQRGKNTKSRNETLCPNAQNNTKEKKQMICHDH